MFSEGDALLRCGHTQLEVAGGRHSVDGCLARQTEAQRLHALEQQAEAAETEGSEPDGPLGVFAVTVPTRLHVLAHSRADALARLAAADEQAPLDLLGGDLPWIDSIYHSQLALADVEDSSFEYVDGMGSLGERYLERHRAACSICRAQPPSANAEGGC